MSGTGLTPTLYQSIDMLLNDFNLFDKIVASQKESDKKIIGTQFQTIRYIFSVTIDNLEIHWTRSNRINESSTGLNQLKLSAPIAKDFPLGKLDVKSLSLFQKFFQEENKFLNEHSHHLEMSHTENSPHMESVNVHLVKMMKYKEEKYSPGNPIAIPLFDLKSFQERIQNKFIELKFTESDNGSSEAEYSGILDISSKCPTVARSGDDLPINPQDVIDKLNQFHDAFNGKDFSSKVFFTLEMLDFTYNFYVTKTLYKEVIHLKQSFGIAEGFTMNYTQKLMDQFRNLAKETEVHPQGYVAIECDSDREDTPNTFIFKAHTQISEEGLTVDKLKNLIETFVF